MKTWNKLQNKPSSHQTSYGYQLDPMDNGFVTGRASICLIKAILVFCASLGTIGSIVSAFSLSLNMPLLILSLFVFSLLLAFLHYNHFLFNVCYPVIFVIFAVTIVQNRVAVNSGFQALGNMIREAYRDYFELSFSRESNEMITNRYVTLTFTMIYLGFFLAVLLNIAISTYMSTFFTIVLTFPFLQFGLYIGNIPGYFYLLLLLFSYICVWMLQWSGHFLLSENKKKDKPFIRKKNRYVYKGHGITMAQTTLLAFCLSLIFSLLAYPAMRSNFLAGDSKNILKEKTDAAIKTYVQNGLYSFFNRYQATGGISDGKLGGVGSVSADYETDLEVTFVPTSYETIYLKAYVGCNYTGTSWEAPVYSEDSLENTLGANKYDAFSDYASHLEAKRLKTFGQINPKQGVYAKMEIRNIGASTNHLYQPYYTDGTKLSLLNGYKIDHCIPDGSSPLNAPYTLSYYPRSQDFYSIIQPDYDQLAGQDYTTDEERSFMQFNDLFCKLHYSDVPAVSKKALEKIKAEIGESDTITGQIELIQNYLSENYEYTLSPGNTPKETDFVSYFLLDQKKGYCAHFASAATLLCRSYGIPARYVEGYVIKLNNMIDASVRTDENPKQWFFGNNTLKDAKVITVSIPDANAHAWVEIYADGFGWIPFEFTPASTTYDDEGDESMLQSLFRNLFGFSGDSDQTNNHLSDTSPSDLLASGNFLFLPTLIVVLCILLLPITWRLLKWYQLFYKRNAAYRKGDYAPIMAYYFNRLVYIAKKKKRIEADTILPEDFYGLFMEEFDANKTQLKKDLLTLEQTLYSPNKISKADVDAFIAHSKQLYQQIKK